MKMLIHRLKLILSIICIVILIGSNSVSLVPWQPHVIPAIAQTAISEEEGLGQTDEDSVFLDKINNLLDRLLDQKINEEHPSKENSTGAESNTQPIIPSSELSSPQQVDDTINDTNEDPGLDTIIDQSIVDEKTKELANAKVQVLNSNSTGASTVATLASGTRIETSINVILNVDYTPSAKDLALEKISGVAVYDLTIKAVKSDGVTDYYMSYFLPYTALSADALNTLTPSSPVASEQLTSENMMLAPSLVSYEEKSLLSAKLAKYQYVASSGAMHGIHVGVKIGVPAFEVQSETAEFLKWWNKLDQLEKYCGKAFNAKIIQHARNEMKVTAGLTGYRIVGMSLIPLEKLGKIGSILAEVGAAGASHLAHLSGHLYESYYDDALRDIYSGNKLGAKEGRPTCLDWWKGVVEVEGSTAFHGLGRTLATITEEYKGEFTFARSLFSKSSPSSTPPGVTMMDGTGKGNLVIKSKEPCPGPEHTHGAEFSVEGKLRSRVIEIGFFHVTLPMAPMPLPNPGTRQLIQLAEGEWICADQRGKYFYSAGSLQYLTSIQFDASAEGPVTSTGSIVRPVTVPGVIHTINYKITLEPPPVLNLPPPSQEPSPNFECNFVTNTCK